MKIRQVYYILGIAVAVIACAPKKTETNNQEQWPQMDLFHLVITKAYHPFRDSANLEPAKQLADDLVREAEHWADSPLPDSTSHKEIRPMLTELETAARAFADRVSNGDSDAVISAKLEALHKIFHEIQESWRGKENEHAVSK